MRKKLRLLLSLLLFVLMVGQSVPSLAIAQEVEQPYHYYLPIVHREYVFIPQQIGPFTGRVLGVGQDSASPSTVYAITFGSGVYKSTDSGASWAPSSAGISYLVLQSMAADPVTPNTLYVGTYGDSSVPYSGVFKSADGGATWQPTGEISTVWNGTRYDCPVVYALAVDSLHPERVFAGTRMKYLPSGSLGGGGVFRSENGGASWTPVNSGLPYDDLYVYDLALDPAHPGRVYAALHEHGLYRSDNYGSSWYSLSGTPYAGRAVAVDPFNSNTIYFGAVKKLGLRRSENSGADWSRIGGIGWDTLVGAISADPYHQGVLYAGIQVGNSSYYLMRSTDRGDSWNMVDRINTWGQVAFSPGGRVDFIGVDYDGPYRSLDDGLTWRRSVMGLSGFSVTGLAISPASQSTLYAALYGLGVYTSTNAGASWTMTSAGLENPGVLALAADPGNASLLYAATDQSGVYRSTNGGQSWGVLSSGYPQAAASAIAPAPFENRPLPERDDLKENPEAPSLLSTAAPTGLAAANSIAVSPSGSTAVLVGTTGRGVYRWNGSSWSASSLTSGTVYSILFDRALAGRVLAAAGSASGGVLVSANNGQTWQASNAGLSGRTVYSLAQSQANPSVFLAGSDSGVYQSTDGGGTWSRIGLAGQAVTAVGVLPVDGNLFFAGTASAAYYFNARRGAWVSLEAPFKDTGIQGILPDPSGHALYFYSRLGGTTRVDVK
jgi:photosystem II stability/assembly factor-like uncharacterized protein